MEYAKKVCPVCGTEFVVVKSIAERDLFCTLGCLSRAEGNSLAFDQIPSF